MHVGVMGRSVRPGATGVGRFAENIIRALADAMPGGKISAFLTQEAASFNSEKIQEIRAPWPTPNEYARMLWEQLVVPRQARDSGVEVYHSPNYILPLRNLDCPTVVTVHDLSFRHAALHRLRSYLYLSVMTGAAVRKARLIIADSEHTRRGIEQHYPHTRGRIEVIYGGLAPGLRTPDASRLASFRATQGLDRPVILYVGTLEPRKNLTRLVHAYDRAVARHELPHLLVLLGPSGWRMGSIRRAISNSKYRDRIICPGYAGDAALSLWYAAADLLAYPSLDEGFGLPALEAMALGTPVVTSGVSALPEVVGDAAILVDPYDVESIAAGIAQALTKPDLAQRLIDAGKVQASQFTWLKAAERHLAAYRRALNGTAA